MPTYVQAPADAAWLTRLSGATPEDLSRHLRAWLDTVADNRLHGSTRRVVAEHLAAERASLKALPIGPFDAVLRTERRISHEGLVSVGGRLYGVRDDTVKWLLEAETTANCVRIHDGRRLVAVHALLHGQRQRLLLPEHRQPRRSIAAPDVARTSPVQTLGT